MNHPFLEQQQQQQPYDTENDEGVRPVSHTNEAPPLLTQNEEPFEYSPEIMSLSTPYISAFQATFVHETHTVRQALKDYDDARMKQQQNTTTASMRHSNRIGYGHKERILGCDISLDNK